MENLKLFKPKEERFKLVIRKKFFPVSWNRFPREAVDAQSLGVFPATLDGALSNLVQWQMSLSMGRGLKLHDL